MAKYYRQQGETRQRKLLRVFRSVAVSVLLILLAACGWLAYDIFTHEEGAHIPSQATKPITSSVASSVHVQTTPYFQIQLPAKWSNVANETRDGHYVYRQFNGPLVEQDLTIEVNNSVQVTLATTRINRVLPIDTSTTGRTDIIEVPLDHCKKAAFGTKNPLMVTLDKVSFPCNPDSTGYEVVVGSVGGSNIMNLSRPGGSVGIYKITYRNVSALPSPRDFLQIMRSFETR